MNLETNKINKSIRPSMLMGLFISFSMLAIAFFFQYFMLLEPCPLCGVARIIVIIMSVVFFIAFIHAPIGWTRRLYGLILTLISSLGAIVAVRHTWLQHLPKDQIPECGPGLVFWLNNLPLNEVIQKVFIGSGDCAEIAWTFIGMSIPEWNLIVFILFLVISLKLLLLAR